jgi:hypothetical protein
MTIDTLDYVDKLIAAGVDRKQAEAHARAIRETLAPQLATKADLDLAVARLEAKLGAEVARLEAKMDALAARFEMALWKRTAGIIVTLAGTQIAVGAAVAGVLLRYLR